jgi:hypothetical protein
MTTWSMNAVWTKKLSWGPPRTWSEDELWGGDGQSRSTSRMAVEEEDVDWIDIET